MKNLFLISLLLFCVLACKTTQQTTNTNKVVSVVVAQALPDYCTTGEKYVETARQKYHTEIRPKTVLVYDFGLPDTTMKRLLAQGYRFVSNHSTLRPIQSDSIGWTISYIKDHTYKEYFGLLKDSLTVANRIAPETKEVNAIIQQRQAAKRCWWNK